MPRGPRRLAITGRPHGLTRYGGVYLLHRFLARLGLKQAFAHDLRVPRRNVQYSVGELLLALRYPLILGLRRLETTRLLRTNGVFQYLTGLPRYPHATTLQRFLLETAPQLVPQLRTLHDRWLTRMQTHPRRCARRRYIFDFDSTVRVVYGTQQGAERGYNPIKRGRRSYHPLLCFEGGTQEFWAGELRPGSAHTATGTLQLATSCLAKIPPQHQHLPIFARADKGFYDRAIVEWFDDQQIGFVVVARITAPIKRRLSGLRYRTFRSGLSVAECRYQPTHWTKPYRFVVIRRPVREDEAEQLTLFQLKAYRYQVLVTNLPLTPRNVWTFYNQRACVEQLIRELKGDCGWGRIPTRHYLANEAYVHLLLLAYNVVVWFQPLCLPAAWQPATLQRLRQDLFVTPAYLTRTDNRPRLWVPDDDLAIVWQTALKVIERL